MNKIHRGGTAIMLRVYEVPEQITEIAHRETVDWRNRKMTPLSDLHTTLQFVGRDLPAVAVADVIRAAFFIEPLELSFTGETKQWSTSKGSYFVALLEKTQALLSARELLRSMLSRYAIKDVFAFNPHVTLVEADPGRLEDIKAQSFDPFKIPCVEAVVKYGSRKMTVDL